MTRVDGEEVVAGVGECCRASVITVGSVSSMLDEEMQITRKGGVDKCQDRIGNVDRIDQSLWRVVRATSRPGASLGTLGLALALCSAPSMAPWRREG